MTPVADAVARVTPSRWWPARWPTAHRRSGPATRSEQDVALARPACCYVDRSHRRRLRATDHPPALPVRRLYGSATRRATADVTARCTRSAARPDRGRRARPVRFWAEPRLLDTGSARWARRRRRAPPSRSAPARSACVGVTGIAAAPPPAVTVTAGALLLACRWIRAACRCGSGGSWRPAPPALLAVRPWLPARARRPRT